MHFVSYEPNDCLSLSLSHSLSSLHDLTSLPSRLLPLSFNLPSAVWIHCCFRSLPHCPVTCRHSCFLLLDLESDLNSSAPSLKQGRPAYLKQLNNEKLKVSVLLFSGITRTKNLLILRGNRAMRSGERIRNQLVFILFQFIISKRIRH